MAASESSPLTLDEQLCFALYTASRAMTSCYRTVLERLGLTYPQYLVLLVLWERDESTVGCLGEALHLETGTLSPLLKRLEAAGLIWRRRRRDDERSVMIGLTPDGVALRDRVRDVPHTMRAATGLDEDAIAELRDSLHVLAGRLRGRDTAESA